MTLVDSLSGSIGTGSGFKLLDLVAILLLLFLLNKLVIYPFFLSPVRHIPGPWYARISKLPLQYASFNRRRTEYVTKLLAKYGPTVVIALDQVHTTDDTAMKSIYDKTSVKTSFYSSMGSWKGVKSTLGFLTYPEAVPSRTNLIQCFQNRNLAVLVENMSSHIDDFVRLLDQRVEDDEPVDGVVAFRLLALDIVTDVLWGEQNRLLAEVDEEAARTFIRRFHAFSTWNALKGFIPIADFYVRNFGNKKWRALRSDCDDLDITAKQALERWNGSKDSGQRHDKDVLSMLQSMSSKSSAVPPEELPAYLVEMLAAGSSTTSHTAAFACFLLTRHQECQDTLRQELLEAWPSANDFDITKAMDLPYLDGVLRETMRMYPMIPGPLERYTSKDIVADGYVIAKGVVASTGAYNQGRLKEVFAEPDEWRPDRWLKADDRMKLNWTPFGHGSRACPGSNLAVTELKYMLAVIFRKFRAVVPPGHSDDVLELADVFAAGSRSGHCWLKFERLPQP